MMMNTKMNMKRKFQLGNYYLNNPTGRLFILNVSYLFSAETVSLRKPDPREDLELTIENVNKVLDEVRPYLIADGGNVAVHSVDKEKRSIQLVLEGACGSCPSSTVSIEMSNFENRL